MDSRNNTIEMFLDLMQQQLDEIKKAPINLPDLWGFDNLINSNRKLLEAYQLYEAYQRDKTQKISYFFLDLLKQLYKRDGNHILQRYSRCLKSFEFD